jgi:hypothetical protein
VNKAKELRAQEQSREVINQSKIVDDLLNGFIPPQTFISLIKEGLDSESQYRLFKDSG